MTPKRAHYASGEKCVLHSFVTVAFSIRLLLDMVEEAGFEPTLMLVTSGRLRNAKLKKDSREWREVAAFTAEQSFLTLVTSLRLRV